MGHSSSLILKNNNELLQSNLITNEMIIDYLSTNLSSDFNEYKQIFLTNNINGNLLFNLNNSEIDQYLNDIGIINHTHRMKLYDEILNIKQLIHINNDNNKELKHNHLMTNSNNTYNHNLDINNNRNCNKPNLNFLLNDIKLNKNHLKATKDILKKENKHNNTINKQSIHHIVSYNYIEETTTMIMNDITKNIKNKYKWDSFINNMNHYNISSNYNIRNHDNVIIKIEVGKLLGRGKFSGCTIYSIHIYSIYKLIK